MSNDPISGPNLSEPIRVLDAPQLEQILGLDDETSLGTEVLIPLGLLQEYLQKELAEKEARVRTAQRRLIMVETILTYLQGPIIYYDADQIIQWAGPSARKLLGGDIVGKHVDEAGVLYTTSDLKTFHAVFEAVRESRETHTFETLIADTQVRARYVPIFHGDTFLGVISSSEDITREKEAENGRLYLVHKLAALQSSLEITRLFNGIFHDLANILTGLMGNSELLTSTAELAELDSNGIQEIREMSAAILAQSHHLNKMVRSLRETTREQNPRFEIAYAHDILQELNLLVSRIPRLQGIKVEYLSDEVLKDVQIFVDVDLLKRVLTNLVLNAADAIKDGGTPINGGVIQLILSDHDDKIQIEVHDNGVGIPEEILQNLFLKSFTTKAHGTGQGLIVIKRIVEAHGGVINVRSIVGQGTTFTILLPKTH